MKKCISLLSAIIIMALSTCTVFAENETNSNIEQTTQPTSINDSLENNSEAVAAIEDFSFDDLEEIEEADSIEDKDYFDDELSIAVGENEALIVFSLEGTRHETTVVLSSQKKDYTLVFNKENNYIVQQVIPVGQYTIKDIKTKDEHAKVKLNKIDDKEVTDKTITITHTDYRSIKFDITEKKEMYIIGFLRREWILLIILVALAIGYKIKKDNRVLPSQDT